MKRKEWILLPLLGIAGLIFYAGRINKVPEVMWMSIVWYLGLLTGYLLFS